jgi:hypothetical protein
MNAQLVSLLRFLFGGNVETRRYLAGVEKLLLTFVCGQGNHMVRLVKDGYVRTIAGTGAPGFVDGPAFSARFNKPTTLREFLVFVVGCCAHVYRSVVCSKCTSA